MTCKLNVLQDKNDWKLRGERQTNAYQHYNSSLMKVKIYKKVNHDTEWEEHRQSTAVPTLGRSFWQQ